MKFKEFLIRESDKKALEEGATRFITEGGLSRIWQHLQNRNVGIITAFRGRYTLAENRRRNKQLEQAIRLEGFGFYKAQGHYIENYGTPEANDVHEEVYFVVGDAGNDNGRLKGFLYKQGKRFNQDSVLVYRGRGEPAVLIGCQDRNEDGGDVWPGDRKEVPVGDWHPMKVGQFYTKMKGKPFVFESVEEAPSFFGEWLKHAELKDDDGETET